MPIFKFSNLAFIGRNISWRWIISKRKKAALSHEGGFMDLRDPEQLELIAD